MASLNISCAVANPGGSPITGVMVGSSLTLFISIFIPVYASCYSHILLPPHFARAIDTVLFLTRRDPSAASASTPVKTCFLDQMLRFSSTSTNIDAASDIPQFSTTSISDAGGLPVPSSYAAGKVIVIRIIRGHR